MAAATGGREVRLEASWRALLEAEFAQPYMAALGEFLRARKAAQAAVFPPGEQIFAAFDSTPVERVRVVILGQDPYHRPGQAHGLSFSVPPGVPVPPSLRNIYQELGTDLGLSMPAHGDLRPWAARGVFLLNSVLTVEQGRAGAHQGQGWERFTDAAVRALAERREGLVFLLWGSHASKKGQFLDRRRHLVLRAPHPSPLSAHRGFLGCRHFSQANRYLEARGLGALDWSLPAADP